MQEKEPQKHCEKATIIDAAQCDFKVSFWFDITRLFFIQSTQNILSNGVGLITLRLMVWKWRGSKDNYANQQNTTTTYFYQKTKNLNKIQFSLLCFFFLCRNLFRKECILTPVRSRSTCIFQTSPMLTNGMMIPQHFGCRC